MTLCVRPKGIPLSIGLPSIPLLKPQFKRIPTAHGVHRRSPNQVLIMPNLATCGFRTKTCVFNVVWPLVSDLSPRRLRFHPRLVSFGFVVDSVALEQGFLRLMQLSHASIIPPQMHAHSFVYHWRYVTFELSESLNDADKSKLAQLIPTSEDRSCTIKLINISLGF